MQSRRESNRVVANAWKALGYWVEESSIGEDGRRSHFVKCGQFGSLSFSELLLSK